MHAKSRARTALHGQRGASGSSVASWPRGKDATMLLLIVDPGVSLGCSKAGARRNESRVLNRSAKNGLQCRSDAPSRIVGEGALGRTLCKRVQRSLHARSGRVAGALYARLACSLARYGRRTIRRCNRLAKGCRECRPCGRLLPALLGLRRNHQGAGVAVAKEGAKSETIS